MKKLVASLLVVVLMVSTLSMVAFAHKVPMYALDGRVITVEENEVEAHRQVGWYYGPPVTMYALDGRTLIVGENDVEAYRRVGWYYGKPITMYAKDGKTLTIGENDIEMYRKVGWYLPEELDYSEDILNTVYKFDYMAVYRNFINYYNNNWTIAPPTNHLLPMQFSLGDDHAEFQDAYAIDVDNDGVLELVALFSNYYYGAMVIYECENGQVSEAYRRGGFGYDYNPFLEYALYKNGSEYGFLEVEEYYDESSSISHLGCRLNKGTEGILVGAKIYENNPDWNEYKVYNQPSNQKEAENYMNQMDSFAENGTFLFSAGCYEQDYEGNLPDCDLAKGSNLEKHCMPDIIQDLDFYTKYAKKEYIPDLTLGAFYVYQYGYYYEALDLCNQLLKTEGISKSQKDEINVIINNCNQKLFGNTVTSMEEIQSMIDGGQYYEAMEKIGECRKGFCSPEQLSLLDSLESTCKDKISAYETKMSQYTTIHATSGMELYVQNKEVQGYLDSGVWFLTPQKTWSQMKQAAYQYAKNAVSDYLYYPTAASYPSINQVSFWKESQSGSQAEYVIEFTMRVKNWYGNYITSTFTCTLNCNPYGFYDYYIDEDY